MDIAEVISGVRDAYSVQRVYGEPYEKNGVTVIPAAVVRGGAGGGGGQGGSGGVYGLNVRPAGVWVIDGDKVEWKPAIDITRIALGGQLVALMAILVTGRLLANREFDKRRSLRRHTA